MSCHIREGPDSDNIYYFNFATGESTWEHPCDVFYRKLLQQEREKKAANSKASSKAKTKSVGTSKKKADGESKPSQGKRTSAPSGTGLIGSTTGGSLLKSAPGPGLEAALVSMLVCS